MRWLQQKRRDAKSSWRNAVVLKVEPTKVRVRYEGSGGGFQEDVSPFALRWPPPTDMYPRPR